VIGAGYRYNSYSYAPSGVPLDAGSVNSYYGFAEAQTTYGVIGVKVWIFKGEIMPGEIEAESAQRPQAGATA